MYDMALAHQAWPVPARFRTHTPDDWSRQGRVDYPVEWSQAREWLVTWPQRIRTARNSALIGQGLVLSGPSGTGKTMLATCFVNYLHAKGFSTAFVRDGDLTRLLHRPYPTDEEEEFLAYLQRSACVVVDDVGRTAGTPQEIEPFLRYRLDEGKPTIVTVNDTAVIPHTLHSLLHEFVFITLAGDDRRIHPLEVRDARW